MDGVWAWSEIVGLATADWNMETGSGNYNTITNSNKIEPASRDIRSSPRVRVVVNREPRALTAARWTRSGCSGGPGTEGRRLSISD